jgi:hypothetical protein
LKLSADILNYWWKAHRAVKGKHYDDFIHEFKCALWAFIVDICIAYNCNRYYDRERLQANLNCKNIFHGHHNHCKNHSS